MFSKRKKEPEKKVINVWKAKLVWTYPCHPHRGNYFFYAYDDDTGRAFPENELERMAKYINEALLPEEGREYEINHRPPVEGEVFYLDGYFGRPAVPASSYQYFPMKRQQLKELKQYLAELRSGSAAPGGHHLVNQTGHALVCFL